jgi:ubiquinone biosynthesis protein COQ9
MNDTEFDTALVTAAFAQAGLTGWRGLSIVDAARDAGLPLDRARARFPGPAAVLMRFGVMADAAALAEPLTEPTERGKLFDLLMRRFDVLALHRDGVLALLQALPTQPLLTLALGAATGRSMGWMLEAAGIPASGLRGRMRVNGLVGVWLYTLRAWRDDESADLSGTMAALDNALDQAERFSGMLSGGPAVVAPVNDDDGLEGVVDVPADPDVLAGHLVSINPPPPPMPEPPGSPV